MQWEKKKVIMWGVNVIKPIRGAKYQIRRVSNFESRDFNNIMYKSERD